MVYQEDVIKIALHFAGVPASDGDVLRRDEWRAHGSVAKVKTIFFCVVLQKDILSTESRNIQTDRIFAGYSFARRTRSYAVESYQSLYLKVHYP
jgi:DNA polymerase-3 subunit alpha/error-prone DNA polymerase